jgi:hypothetical protein
MCCCVRLVLQLPEACSICTASQRPAAVCCSQRWPLRWPVQGLLPGAWPALLAEPQAFQFFTCAGSLTQRHFVQCTLEASGCILLVVKAVTYALCLLCWKNDAAAFGTMQPQSQHPFCLNRLRIDLPWTDSTCAGPFALRTLLVQSDFSRELSLKAKMHASAFDRLNSLKCTSMHPALSSCLCCRAVLAGSGP